jgi:IMP dehydrogenase
MAVIKKDYSRSISEFTIRDLALLPAFIPKDLTHDKIELSTAITKYSKKEEARIKLSRFLISADMQAVTGPEMAVGMAREGCLGVIFCSQSIETQAAMVKKVKRYKAGFVSPEVISPDSSIEFLIQRMQETGYSKFFVTEDGESHGKFLGLITDNDFDPDVHLGLKVRDRMIHARNMFVAYDDEIGYDISKAIKKIAESHYPVMPVVFRDNRLRDAVFRKDIKQLKINPYESLDSKKRYLVGAAINTHDYKERVPALVEAGADILFISTSHGYTDFVKETLQFVKDNFDVPIVGGNIVTKEGFHFIVENGADAVKVGMGIGSICITTEKIGMGRGQASALVEITEARDEYFKKTGTYIPIIADGGIRTPKDMLVSLALGADAVMLGRYVVGTDESPNPVDYKRTPPSKPYWGEGSNRAREWMKRRYHHADFEEGVEGWVEYIGPLKPYLHQTFVIVKDGMRKAGAKGISELQQKAILEILSATALEEAGVQDFIMERKKAS